MSRQSIYRIAYAVIFIIVGVIAFSLLVGIAGTLFEMKDGVLERIGQFSALPLAIIFGAAGAWFGKKRYEKKQSSGN